MVKRSEIVDLGGLWLEGHGLSEGSETLSLSSRVRRAAPSLQMQTDEPLLASCGLAKTAISTVRAPPASCARNASSHAPPSIAVPAWKRTRGVLREERGR